MKSAFSLLSLTATLMLVSCNPNVINSNSNDAKKAAVANLDGGPNFKAAIPAIIEKCAGCHIEYYSYDEQSYVDSGQVVFGSLKDSKVYYRLTNANEGSGPRNMPQGGGAALTDEEVSLLETWIGGAFGG